MTDSTPSNLKSVFQQVFIQHLVRNATHTMCGLPTKHPCGFSWTYDTQSARDGENLAPYTRCGTCALLTMTTIPISKVRHEELHDEYMKQRYAEDDAESYGERP